MMKIEDDDDNNKHMKKNKMKTASF